MWKYEKEEDWEILKTKNSSFLKYFHLVCFFNVPEGDRPSRRCKSSFGCLTNIGPSRWRNCCYASIPSSPSLGRRVPGCGRAEHPSDQPCAPRRLDSSLWCMHALCVCIPVLIRRFGCSSFLSVRARFGYFFTIWEAESPMERNGKPGGMGHRRWETFTGKSPSVEEIYPS